MHKPTVFDFPKVSSELRNDYGMSTYRHTRYYLNDSPHPVYVTERSGFRMSIAPTGVPKGVGSFEVCDHYEFENIGHVEQLAADARARVEQIGEANHPDLVLLAKFLTDMSLKGFSNGRFGICLVRTITAREISSKGNIFLPAADVLITHPSAFPVEHPESQIGKSGLAARSLDADKPGTGVYIEIVDNRKLVDRRYVYVCGKILEIKPTIDPSRKDGVYFNVFSDNKDDGTEYAAIEEMSRFGIYPTREQAETNGNPDHLMRERMLLAESELVAMKQSNDRQIHELKLASAEAEARAKKAAAVADKKLRKAQAATAKLKEELASKSAKRSDYYESRSYSRKDSSEMWKFAPLAVGVVLGLGAVLTR